MTVVFVNDVPSYRTLLASALYSKVKAATCDRFTPEIKVVVEPLFDDIGCIVCLGRTLADMENLEKKMTPEERIAFAQGAFERIKQQSPGDDPEEIERNAVAIFRTIVSNASKMQTSTGFPSYSIPLNALDGVLEFSSRKR